MLVRRDQQSEARLNRKEGSTRVAVRVAPAVNAALEQVGLDPGVGSSTPLALRWQRAQGWSSMTGLRKPVRAVGWLEPTHRSRRRLSPRTTGLPWNLTVAQAAEKARDGYSGH
jgi:hypothetical protein